jgi:hypothetical protein
MRFVVAPIVLDDETRAELERQVRASTTSQRDRAVGSDHLVGRRRRGVSADLETGGYARIHVATWRCGDNVSGTTASTVWPTRHAGVRRVDTVTTLIEIAALASTAKDPDDPVATWTYQELADTLHAEVGVSRSQLWRIPVSAYRSSPPTVPHHLYPFHPGPPVSTG